MPPHLGPLGLLVDEATACKDLVFMQVYALTSSQSLHETLDLFLTREAAEAELREILQDEPDQLRWEEVDLAKGVIRVERSWDVKEGAVDPKSTAGTRSVPIASVLRDFIVEHKLRSGRSEGLVFGRTRELPFGRTGIRKRAMKAWQRRRLERARELARAAGYEFDDLAGIDREPFLDQAGFEPITLHECRHTFASLMIDAGVNAKALSSYMGHSSITITLDRYGHLMPGNEDEAAELLDAYLKRADTKARLAQVT